MAASDSLFDSRGRFFGVKLSNEDIPEIEGLRDVATATTFHGNQFWDCITCKWTLMEDNHMRLSCKGWFVISHLWRWELLQTGNCQVGN